MSDHSNDAPVKEESDGSESDWSSTASESEMVRPESGTAVQVEYKSTTWQGVVVSALPQVPSDVVLVAVTASDEVASDQFIWCRPDGKTFAALSRGECRKLLADVIGKSAKTDTPSAADIAACEKMFGTGYPIQVVGVNASPAGSVTAEPLSGDSVPDITFRVGKQTLTGVVVPFTTGARADGVVAVAVNGAAATSSSVYWLTTDVNNKRVPVTVTESRKLMRLLLTKSLSSDGPSSSDVADCIAACGVSCPAQLFDAKNRNTKAKQRRSTAGASAAGGGAAAKRPRPEEVAVPPPKKTKGAIKSDLRGPVTISFTGDVDQLMPIMTAYKSLSHPVHE